MDVTPIWIVQPFSFSVHIHGENWPVAANKQSWEVTLVSLQSQMVPQNQTKVFHELYLSLDTLRFLKPSL